MRYFISILLLTFSLGLSGQNYQPLVTEGNSWSVVTWFHHITYTEHYHILGDTTINSTNYKKLYVTDDSTFQDIGYTNGALREDISQKAVYYVTFNNNEEKLLYKFGEEAGDTATVWSYPCESVIMQVIEVDTIVDLEDVERTRLKVKMFSWGYEEYWIEGIGSTKGLLTAFNEDCVSDFNQDLLCFSKNGVVQYSNPEFTNCHYTTLIIAEMSIDKNSVMIIPNPVVGSSDITIANNEKIKLFKIYDSKGVLVSSSSTAKITKGSLNPGIYCLLLETEEGNTLRSKFVVK